MRGISYTVFVCLKYHAALIWVPHQPRVEKTNKLYTVVTSSWPFFEMFLILFHTRIYNPSNRLNLWHFQCQTFNNIHRSLCFNSSCFYLHPTFPTNNWPTAVVFSTIFSRRFCIGCNLIRFQLSFRFSNGDIIDIYSFFNKNSNQLVLMLRSGCAVDNFLDMEHWGLEVDWVAIRWTNRFVSG
jgi:hypothetical protein